MKWRSINRATSPEAFASSMNAARNAALATRAFGVPTACWRSTGSFGTYHMLREGSVPFSMRTRGPLLCQLHARVTVDHAPDDDTALL